MDVVREGDHLVLGLNFFEGHLLLRSLREIIAHYQVKPEQLEGRIAGAWYSTRGCETARMSAEEMVEWRENLHAIRQSNCQLLQRWERELTPRRHGRHELRIRLGEAPHLLTAVNDHRLFLAALHDIGQEEMDLHSVGQMSKLAPARQAALYQIHVLAYLMEEILAQISPTAGC